MIRLRDDEVLIWLRYRGAGFGNGNQTVSEVLLDRAADEIEEYRSFLQQTKLRQVLIVLGVIK